MLKGVYFNRPRNRERLPIVETSSNHLITSGELRKIIKRNDWEHFTSSADDSNFEILLDMRGLIHR